MTNAIQNAVAKNGAGTVTPSNPQAQSVKTLRDTINRMSGEIAKALPSVITPERFTRIILSAISTTPKLAECTPASFLGAMMQAAQLGLEANTPLGQAYLIPRWSSKKKVNECNFQIGYKGMIDLAYRSGQVSTIGAYTVYEHDEFSYSLGLNPDIKHVPAMENRGDPVAFYAVVKMKDGGFAFDVMSIQDVREHAQKFSESVKNGTFSPWQTNFDEMAKKTVLKRALKYCPMKSDFVRAVTMDDTVKTDISDDMSLVPPVIEAEAEITDPETGEILTEKKE